MHLGVELITYVMHVITTCEHDLQRNRWDHVNNFDFINRCHYLSLGWSVMFCYIQ